MASTAAQQFDALREPRARVDRPRDALALVLLRAIGLGLDDLAADGGVRFSIGTMCSGTDAPILALRELQDAALAVGYNSLFDFDHVYSVEIEAYKQAFIERNSRPSGEIFRDVVEVSDPGRTEATTAHGSLAPIPAAPDILVAGSSCVDFSKLNNKREIMEKHSVVAQQFQQSKQGDTEAELGDVTPQSKSTEVREALRMIRNQFDTEGESARTFISILQYVYDRRPRVVILENVALAPWSAFTKFWLPLVGYVAMHTKVDSKDFLVPQTRNRGYLVAFDQWHYGTDNAVSMVQAWKNMMDPRNWFVDEYPPVHKFLLPPSDHRILEARAVEERRLAENISRDVEARMCSFDHAKVRRENSLGPGHPFTQRDSRGNLVPRDTCWQAYMIGAAGRVQDIVDITFLLERKRGKELNYKSAYMDLGEGVERLKTQIGVVGCILPDGDLFATDQGRPLLGIEALTLQGLPIDRIHTSVEKQSELHNMAGNAMTTTVVGAALLCALTVERQITNDSDFEHGLARLNIRNENDILHRLFAVRRTERNGTFEAVPPSFRHCPEFSTFNSGQTAVRQLMHILDKGRRYCPCAGYRKHNPAAGLMRCTTCREVRCRTCAGNPTHAFETLHVEEIWSEDETMHALKRLLPGRFLLTGRDFVPQDDEAFQRLSASLYMAEEEKEEILSRLQALRGCGEAVYYLDCVDVGQIIVVTYNSIHGCLKLSIGEEQIAWHLFLPEPAEPDPSQKHGPIPIARAVLDTSSEIIFPDKEGWEVYFVQPQPVALFMESLPDSALRCTVAEFRGRSIESYETVPEVVTGLVAGVGGVYKLHQNCGTPFDLLYTRHPKDDDPLSLPTHIFLDTKSLTEPKDDVWVASSCVRKLDPDSHREVFCKFPESWKEEEEELRQPGVSKTVHCEIPGIWLRVYEDDSTIANFNMTRLDVGGDRTVGEGPEDLHVNFPAALRFPDVSQAPVPVLQLRLSISNLPFPVPLLPQLWKTNGEIFDACATEITPDEKWMRVNEHHHKDTIALVSFALDKLKSEYLPKELQDGLIRSAGVACQTLDVDFPTPKIHLLSENGRAKRLFDDPNAAQTLADSYTKRPLPLEMDIQLVKAGSPRLAGNHYNGPEGENETEYPELIVRILMNPTALAHRAWLHLPRDGLVRGVRRDIEHDGRLGFAVNVEFVDPSLKSMESFEACLSSAIPHVSSNHLNVQVPSFESNGTALRPDQLLSVGWMIQQESDETYFVEKEVEEFLVPSSSIRLRSHAEVANRANGGVLAHDVGFGKTIVTLALIDHQRNQDEGRSVTERYDWTGGRHCHLKATIIVCPPQIVLQWCDEIEKFLGSENWTVVVIEAKTQFNQDLLESADIIILSTAFIQSARFTQDLVALTGTSKGHDVNTLSSREFDLWYRGAIDLLEDSLCYHINNDGDNDDLSSYISRGIKERDEEYQTAKVACVEDSRRKDQKRKTIVKPPASKSRKKTKPTAPLTESSDSDSDSDSANRKRKVPSVAIGNEFSDLTVLQMYSFDRVVLDEFSYENKKIAAFVTSCVAASKWTLSGTPPMADLSQVCAIGDLVNIHIARPELSIPMSFPSITKGPRLGRVTKGEALRQYSEPKSAQFALERHEQARAFLQQKVTRRETDTSRIQVTEQVLVCVLDPVSAVVYAQLQQLLYDSKWDIETISGSMRGIIGWLLDQTDNTKSSKARENLRVSWRNTIQSLLVQSSTNLSAYGENMRKLGMNVNSGATSGVSVLADMVAAYQNDLDRLKAMMKSQFDMLMYVSNQVEKSGIATNPATTTKAATKRDKALIYKAHFDELIRMIITSEPCELGGIEIRDDLYRAFAPRTALDWWELTEEDLDAMDNNELQHLESVLIRLAIQYGDRMEDEARNADLKESICELLETGVMSRYREAETKEVVTNLGLTSEKLLAAYWEDKTKAKDFELGNRFRAYRPKEGEDEHERGTTHDQATNRMTMARQSIQAGVEEYTRQFRRFRVLRNVQKLFKFVLDIGTPQETSAPPCDLCGSQEYTEMRDMNVFLACGHLLCTTCADVFESMGQDVTNDKAYVCPVDSCNSLNHSTLVPCDQLISATAASTLDFDGTSAKVAKIMDVIRDDVKDEEKVLLFVSNGKLKTQLYNVLKGNFDTYMTAGVNQDALAIKSFKQPNEPGKKKVLIQSLMSAESAGTNLTEANHVMFAAPLHTDARNYYMYMRQAKGRAIRFGQTRPVKVYHFVTAHTMEVDVLEQRLKHKILLREGEDRMSLDNVDRELYALDAAVGVKAHGTDKVKAPANAAPGAVLKRIRPYFDEVEIRRLLNSQEYDEWQDEFVAPAVMNAQQTPTVGVIGVVGENAERAEGEAAKEGGKVMEQT
ncbi:hypothetical protein ACHAQA_001856 [Verticillium albo-atrum]